MQNIKELLEREIKKRNNIYELSFEKPDPLLIARKYRDEYISLISALFAYGNAKLILKFLNSLDFSLLKEKEEKIRKEVNYYYRFQNRRDVEEFFITIKRLMNVDSLENIFYQGYKRENSVLEGIFSTIKEIYRVNPYSSKGYSFLIGSIPKKRVTSPYKRWNIYLRWMVREDNLDLGLWKKVDKKDLIIPLDTHTFNVSRKLGLIERKSYDLKSAILLTEKLREFDKNDPIKYDFALYRIGQERLI